jgi:hypothetical protein
MRTKTGKRVDMSVNVSADHKPGTRFVKTRYDGVSGIVEFSVFLVMSDDQKLRVFGGGAFEEKDLQSVAAELSKLARDFELCDAQAEGYMQAVEDAEKKEAE